MIDGKLTARIPPKLLAAGSPRARGWTVHDRFVTACTHSSVSLETPQTPGTLTADDDEVHDVIKELRVVITDFDYITIKALKTHNFSLQF